jgi:hypothetical protein
MSRSLLALAVALLALAGCEAHAPASASPVRPLASIQDIMNAVVDPAADSLWDAVSTEVSRTGVQDKRPRNDEEWLAVRHQAVTLIESANLLVVDGRRLAAPGKVLEDAHTPGILTAAEAQQAIDADRPTFVQRAHDLQDAAVLALAAADAKDPDALVKAGGGIDRACEQCHLRFWYPNGGPPKLAALGDKLR